MPTNALANIKRLADAAFNEVGLTMPVTLDGDELIIRDLILYEEDGEVICLEAANPEQPFLRQPADTAPDVAAAVVIHILKGIVIRTISRAA